MKKQIYWGITGILLLIAIIFTIFVKCVDVKPIGPLLSEVGFANLNSGFRDLTGNNNALYQISKYLGVALFLLAGAYIVIGIYQLFKTKSIKGVDISILALGLAYVVIIIIYALFEVVVINYRPILEDGELAASFPSSHTLLAVSICGTSILANKRLYENKFLIKSKVLFLIIESSILLLGLIVVITRTFSGVHWLTDIFGGLLFSSFIIMLYQSILAIDNKKSIQPDFK